MNSVTYQETQWATVILSLMLVALLGVVFAAGVSNPLVWVVGVVLAVAGILFSSLTVSVDEKAVRWYFGPGFWRKSVALIEITRVRSVRNKWWYGWGIRYTPHGWLYNVSGFDAVELQLANGNKLRIGTDEPDRLRQTIEAECGAARRI